jgi:hypothetical protein
MRFCPSAPGSSFGALTIASNDCIHPYLKFRWPPLRYFITRLVSPAGVPTERAWPSFRAAAISKDYPARRSASFLWTAEKRAC